MSGDPLTPYRKKSASAAGDGVPPRSPADYIAFDAKDSVLCLTILRKNDPARSPEYQFKLDVVYDNSHFKSFIIVYSYMMVIVNGRNLEPVVMALKMKTADFIQEFDSSKWQKPTDDKAPFIESIKIVTQENGPSIAQSEKIGKEKQPGLNLH